MTTFDVLAREDLSFPHSLPEFQRLFPDDTACAAYLEKARWRDGFACPWCGVVGGQYFAANAVRLQLHALAYNLGNFMRTLAMPKAAKPWSLTSLREKLIKIGAKVVSHSGYVTFQMAEIAVSRQTFLGNPGADRSAAGTTRAA
jgi:hypothetical protein